ncbi:MAG TPA: DUF1778 domain-containing protein [Nitrospira sp.]|jgi:uncharacterized protein (DUF1778 family)|nr:DUF1778 domain-containing protein [Nitrospira sp.]HNA27537.1 DUF1778 domain-containing protein [Nitrospira sp.]HNI67183.1 DUF1778 domain-containing protein [Nitrospira sp.]HNK16119.1 DUF1778 domain-containing protein [Nitrospira sp.]HNL87552.1 DUF1778 domain-containing protein [Nitrospira sp.]
MPVRSVRREKLDLRLSSADKRILEAAASLSNRSVNEFVRESAVSRAHEMLADRRTFLLSQSKWADFQAALDAPTRHNPRIQRLLTEPGFFDADPSSAPAEKH